MSTKPAKKAAATPEVAQGPAETPAKADKQVQIKVLRSHPRLGYSEGDEGSIPQSLYDELLKDGPFFEKI